MFTTFRRCLPALAAAVLITAACTGSATIDAQDQAAEPDADVTPSVAQPTAQVQPTAEAPPTSATSTSPTPTAAPASAVEPAPSVYKRMADVDFFNFTYDDVGGWVDEPINVVDGVYETGEFGDEDYFAVYVTEVEVGDLDADGVDDALVAVSWNGGGTGYFDSVRAFRLIDGQPVAAGVVFYGDRADGGIQDLYLEDGRAWVHSFDGGNGACCPTRLATSNLLLGTHSLVQADRSASHSWMWLDGTIVPEVKFLPGTTSGFLTLPESVADATVLIDAAAGQVITPTVFGGDNLLDVAVIDRSTGQPVDIAADRLPNDGFYEVRFSAPPSDRDQITVQLIIDDATAERVTWLPDGDQRIVANQPGVRTSVSWPVFSGTAAGVAHANVAIEQQIQAFHQQWIELFDPSIYEADTVTGSFEADYTVTLVTLDLVSVRFNWIDAVWAYPNYGNLGVVLDLEAGRLLADDEILDMNRTDEIRELWMAQLQIESPSFADAYTYTSENDLRIDSVNLVPGGVELGIDRSSGALPGFTTVLPFAQLGDLVRPTIIERLAAG